MSIDQLDRVTHPSRTNFQVEMSIDQSECVINDGDNVNNNATAADSVPTLTGTPTVIGTQTVLRTPSISSNDRLNALMVNYTPGGSAEWIRSVELQFMPTLKRRFQTLDEGIMFYRIYALSCGFDTRLYTTKLFRDGKIKYKSVVCNRQGWRENKKNKPPFTVLPVNIPNKPKGIEEIVQSEGQRKVKITRIGCRAHIRFHLSDGVYVVDQFHEGHNHRLCNVKEREFQKIRRNLTVYHKQLIIDHTKLNIGASKSFRLCKEYTKGYSNVGASLCDFKNFQRDIKCFIGDKDAQLFINRFKELSDSKRFYFAYHVDENQFLSRVFWADFESRKNYSLFGDAISFDPTYGTNKYCMVFCPFTGVDHHKKSVIFGCCLMSNEDEESFKWCFEKFLDAMGQKEPQCIITDQDPAMKNAVPAIFKNARHRFCMWHIMEKVTDKVGSAICKDTEFLNRLNSVVWNPDLEPTEFEEQWQEVISEFSLERNTWLSTMFSLRAYWIPAYHRDIPMGCILRTTQRSESENSFFKRFQNHFGTLVEFWMRFETAMDQQRYSQKCLDKDSDHSLPVTVTNLLLESHAATVYTHAVFYEFQEEIRFSVGFCGVAGFTDNGKTELTDVFDSIKRKRFQVWYDVDTKDAKCSCKHFETKGLLCRHIVWVLAGKSVTSIPNHYLLRRWTKNAHNALTFDSHGNVVEDYDAGDVTKMHLSQVWTEFHATVSVIKSMGDDTIKDFAQIIKQFRDKLKISTPAEPLTKDQEIAVLLGCSPTTVVNILPPCHSKNKGSGLRMVSKKNQAIKKAAKRKRRCANCKQIASHNRRTCTLPFVKDIPESEQEIDDDEEEEQEEDEE